MHYYAFVFMLVIEIRFWWLMLSVSCCFKCFSGSNYLQLHSRGESWMATDQPFWPYCWCGGWSRGWWGIRLHPSMPWILILASWDWSFFHAKQVRTSSFCTCSVRKPPTSASPLKARVPHLHLNFPTNPTASLQQCLGPPHHLSFEMSSPSGEISFRWQDSASESR